MDLSKLRRKRDYYTSDSPDWVRIVFRSFESFDWFCKDNRDALLAAGALMRIGRDYFVETEQISLAIVTLRCSGRSSPTLQATPCLATRFCQEAI